MLTTMKAMLHCMSKNIDKETDELMDTKQRVGLS